VRAIKAYLKKEFIDLVRTKMIFLVYIFPALVLLLFGGGIKLSVNHIRTVIVDYDNSKISKDIAQKYVASKYFDVKFLNNENKAFKLLKNGKKDLLIIFPQNFSKNLIKDKAEVGIFVDGAFPFRGLMIENYAKGVFLSLIPNKIKLDYRFLYNPSLRDENSIVPGVIGLALLIAPAILAALLIVKEKERGTIFNFYSSKVSKTSFIIAKLLPPFLLHFVNVFILFLIAVYVFDVPFRGSFLLYVIASIFYLAISVGIGLLVSIITSTQIAALILTILITLIPGFLYSGIIMPISSMTGEAYIEAHLFPVMYYNHLIYDAFLGGEGFNSLLNLKYLFILFLYAIFLILIGSLLLRKGER